MGAERRIHGWKRLGIAIASVLALALIVIPAAAQATLPGENGRIVFDRDPGTTGSYHGIFAVNPDGSQHKDVLIGGLDADRAPAVSPDGSQIVYATGGTDPEISLLPFGGGSPEMLVDTHDKLDGGPTFTPDGHRVLFHSAQDIDGSCCEIAWIEPGAVSATGKLTSTVSDELNPDPSPDGTKIAYQRGGRIWIMNANGSGQSPLTTSGGVEPSFSPDGTKIAFSSSRDGNPNIYVMNADGSDERRLTSTPAHEQGPSFSPDGTKIAYASGPSDNGGDIYVMNADGSGKTAIVDGPEYIDDDPHWVPLPASYGVTEDGVPGDTDGDGVPDGSDALPLDPSNRGDADGDGVPDSEDAFPHDPAEHADSDGDGIGDMADPDDDNDGVPDVDDAFPLNPGKSIALTVKAKPKQSFDRLFVRVGCGASACTVKGSGKAKVKPRGKGKGKAKSFKLKAKPKRAKVKAGKAKKIRLVVKGKQRKQLGRMLKRGKGSAKIKLRASTPAGAKVSTKVKVKLKKSAKRPKR